MKDNVKPEMVKVLIACEESQRVCIAFRKRGFEAYSADTQEQSGGHPEWHILGDVLKVLQGGRFSTMDGTEHSVEKWDLIIAHPPCTYLSNAGACRLYPTAGQLCKERYEKGLQGKAFFMRHLQADCKHIAVENPIPSTVYDMPPYTQIIQPYEYGEPYSKRTCLWLKNLPKLVPTKVLTEYKPYLPCNTSHNKGNKDKTGVSRSGGSSKVRSKTFQGIAQAMAQQWGDYLLGKTDKQLSFFDEEWG